VGSASIYWHGAGYREDRAAHPHRFEHFGISVVEAMSTGAVPVVYGAAGPAEVVRDGVDGRHWHRPEELVGMTAALIADPEELARSSRSASTRARDFDVAVFAERLRALLHEASTRASVRVRRR
jgi:glycosyltransferase involved in cell wall biosynthesis